jgi:hypothetical protein
MRTRQMNAIRSLEADGYLVKVVDQNFSDEFIVYAYHGGGSNFKEYIVSSAGNLIHVKSYPFTKDLFEFFQSVETIPLSTRRRRSVAESEPVSMVR